MKLLQVNHRVFEWIWICPAPDGTSRKVQRLYNLFSVCSLLILASTFVANLTFLYKHLSVDFEQSLYSLFTMLVMIMVFHSYIDALLQRDRINEIFIGFQNFYNTCKLNWTPIFFIHLSNYSQYFGSYENRRIRIYGQGRSTKPVDYKDLRNMCHLFRFI